MGPSPSKFIEFRGLPVAVCYSRGLRDVAGHEAHAATYIRQRLIVLDEELKSNPAEHARILTHELFHFVWVRLGNELRLEWEGVLTRESSLSIRGEAGWSAEWRKVQLTRDDVHSRTRKWREYCCEAFCDTAALIHTGVAEERTLSLRHMQRRATWFRRNFPEAPNI